MIRLRRRRATPPAPPARPEIHPAHIDSRHVPTNWWAPVVPETGDTEMSTTITRKIATLRADADLFVDLAILAADSGDRDAKRMYLTQAEHALATAEALTSRKVR